MVDWIILGGAIITEVVGTICLKLADGMTHLVPFLGAVVFYILSVIGLVLALRTIDMGVAYAVWAGLGIVLITLIGIFSFGEALTSWRIFCIVLILIGSVGLNITRS